MPYCEKDRTKVKLHMKGAYFSPVQDICMPAMRTQASAIYTGVITMVASVGGYVIVSILSPSFLFSLLLSGSKEHNYNYNSIALQNTKTN